MSSQVVGKCGHIHDEAAWCECTPQWVIDATNRTMDMLIRGYDPNSDEDVKRYEADHYGRHDSSAIGLLAWQVTIPSIVGDDRLPSGFIVASDSFLGQLLCGKHRTQTETCFCADDNSAD